MVACRFCTFENADGAVDCLICEQPLERAIENNPTLTPTLNPTAIPCWPSFIIICTGLPGSGKSTFARQLDASFPGVIVTVCQDVLKSRGKCEKGKGELNNTARRHDVTRQRDNPHPRYTTFFATLLALCSNSDDLAGEPHREGGGRGQDEHQ